MTYHPRASPMKTLRVFTPTSSVPYDRDQVIVEMRKAETLPALVEGVDALFMPNRIVIINGIARAITWTHPEPKQIQFAFDKLMLMLRIDEREVVNFDFPEGGQFL
jgi:hypothetical protein